MGATLIINPGSSSKKFALYANGSLVLTWHFERNAQGFTVCTEERARRSLCSDISGADYVKAIEIVLRDAANAGHVSDTHTIETVGIRIVAPATFFTKHRYIDDEYVERLAALLPLAPHHIPDMLNEIEHVRRALSKARLIGVSDSTFHTSVPRLRRMVAIPRDDAEQFDIERFGYHGISVASVIKRLEARAGGVPKRLIVCHVGSGVSVTAVQNGKSVANSMGYTPVSGLMMSSRMGDVSADVIATLALRKNLSHDELFSYLYNNGGFKALTGVSDLRVIFDRADKNDHTAKEALELFAFEMRSCIASYAMLLGGVDAIVLTATAAERNPAVRSLLVGALPLLETGIDEKRNDALVGAEGNIETSASKVRLMVLKTDEIGEMYRIVTEFE